MGSQRVRHNWETSLSLSLYWSRNSFCNRYFPKWSFCLGKIVVQLLSCVRLFVTPWMAACQASLSFTVSWSLVKLMSIDLVMLFNHHILCCPLLHLPSFPSSGSFAMSQFFATGGQRIGASVSASVLPMNTLISFRIDWLDLLAVQETLKSLL